VLTADYDRLGLRAGDRLLDLGCGFGRHAFEALRRGARVVACDMALPELVQVLDTAAAMLEAGEIAPGLSCTSVNGDGTRLPFADGSFDRIIASEVMEHVPDDLAALDELTRVLCPGGTIAVTVPAWLPEKVCWALSADYHAPAVAGGHVRIYTEGELRRKMLGAGLQPGGAHLEHALHSPYWWLRCAVGPTDDDHVAVRAYRRLLEWDIVSRPAVTRLTEKALNPVLGKSLVVYATKPISRATAPPAGVGASAA
jgi:SAM-dependent methyltransferase